jgi:hypothetical protein
MTTPEPPPGIWNFPTLGNPNLTTEAPRPMPLPRFDYGPDSEKVARPPKRRDLPGLLQPAFTG